MTNDELVAHIEHVIANYEGDAESLSGAIGALMIGRSYGWRVLRIVIAGSSYTKYQRILGLEFKSVLPAVTEMSKRSRGYVIVTRLKNFWDVVRGVATIDSKDKRMFSDDNVLA
jgi:hypothetical protein